MNIRVVPTPLLGLLVIESDFFRDARGFFIENYHRRRFASHGITDEFVQDNHSRSGRGVLRGFHYQGPAAPMGKLVRCTAGEIFDVAVDLRVTSPTFAKWFGLGLTEENMKQLFVPSGFGHAFLTLSESADVQYKCTGYYDRPAEGGIRWDDPDIGVEWPRLDPVLSARDSNAMSLKDYLRNPAFA